MTTNKTKIDNYVTATVAKDWDENPEKTMFFVEVLADLEIDLTLRDNPDQFDFLQNHFEDAVEATLTSEQLLFKIRDWGTPAQISAIKAANLSRNIFR
jgi:hypothetical protein